MNRITYGSHLRGFVHIRRVNARLRTSKWGPAKLPVMEWGLVNTTTGKVIVTDATCCTVERAVAEAELLVTAAREAWMNEMQLKDLRIKGER